MITNTPKIEVG